MSDTQADTTAALDALLQPFNRSDAPGLVVGVAQHGRLLLRRGVGLASVQQGVANTPATRMRIGSVSKHFTSLVALLLAEEGRLDIDAPAATWLPELHAPQGTPTLRQLMQHTSGWRCHVELLTLAAGMAVQPAGRALAMLLRQTACNFAPGDVQLYSNGGYHLLSQVIQRVTGQPLQQVLHERLFAPLALHGTALLPSDLQVAPGVADLHVPLPAAAGGGWRHGVLMQEDCLGEGGMVSTIDDMLTWLAHLRDALQGRSRVGSEQSWQQLVAPAHFKGAERPVYGLGLVAGKHRGAALLRHGGGVVGGLCEMVTLPDHGLDVIVITNTLAVQPQVLSRQIIDAVLAGRLTGQPPRRPATRRYKHLLGAVYDAPGAALRIGFGDVAGTLGIALNGAPPAPVLRDDDGALFVCGEDAVVGEFEFAKPALKPGPDGHTPATLTYTQGSVTVRLRRLPTTPPDTRRVGRALVGRYRCDDIGATATVAFEGAALVLRMQGEFGVHAWTLRALSPEAWTATSHDPLVPAAAALSVLRQGSRAVALVLNTVRTRHLRFERNAAEAEVKAE